MPVKNVNFTLGGILAMKNKHFQKGSFFHYSKLLFYSMPTAFVQLCWIKILSTVMMSNIRYSREKHFSSFFILLPNMQLICFMVNDV